MGKLVFSAAGILIFAFSLMAATPKKSNAPADAAARQKFVILATSYAVNLHGKNDTKTVPQGYDSVPFLTLDDIKCVRYETSQGIETSIELNPAAYEKIAQKVKKLNMCSFLMLLDSTPVYSGIFVPHDYSIDYLTKSNYIGLVIVLPPTTHQSSETSVIGLAFIPQEGMYDRKDDPRGNKQMVDFLRAKGKLKFEKSKEDADTAE